MAFTIEVEELTVKLEDGGFVILTGIEGICDDDGRGLWQKVASTTHCDASGLVIGSWLDEDGSNAEWQELCDGFVTDPMSEAMDAEARLWVYDSFSGQWWK